MNKKLGFFNSVHPILCVCRTVLGYFDACSELSWRCVRSSVQQQVIMMYVVEVIG